MENKTKIAVSVLLFIVSLFNQSCDNKPIRNPNLCIKTRAGNWYITLNDSVFIKEVIDEDKKVPISKIIDFTTFDYLYKYKEDSVKFNNPFYSHNPSGIYYKDKNFLYFLIRDTSSHFLLHKKCRSNQYEILGGEYLKIFASVYYRDKAIVNADYNTFKTMNVTQYKSELDITVGLDKNNIFYGASVMSKGLFETLYWENKDSLKVYYHY